MRVLLLGASIIAMTSVAMADTTAQTTTPKQTSPTVQMPPSDPNAGDASAYTLPQDGLTSSADNAESGRAHQEKVEADKIMNPPPPPEPVPDQNSY